jgi:hypothetical protein
MRITRSLVPALLAALAVVAAPPRATAQPIPIVNPGFEADVLGDGAFIFSATGWTVTGDAGTFNPTVASYLTEAPEGQNVAFASGRGGSLEQTLAAVWLPNVHYAFQVLVGDRLDSPFAQYTVQLLAGGGDLSSITSSVSPGDGVFAPLSIGITLAPANPAVGQAIGIRLSGLGGQVNFDDLSLIATSTVPEPATMALTAGGLALLGVSARRRRGRR